MPTQINQKYAERHGERKENRRGVYLCAPPYDPLRIFCVKTLQMKGNSINYLTLCINNNRREENIIIVQGRNLQVPEFNYLKYNANKSENSSQVLH